MLDMQEEAQTQNTEELQAFVNGWPTYNNIVHRVFNLIIPNFCEQLEAYLKECIQVSKRLDKQGLEEFKSYLITEPSKDAKFLISAHLDYAYKEIAKKYPALHNTIHQCLFDHISDILGMLAGLAAKRNRGLICNQLEAIYFNTHYQLYVMFVPLLCEPRYAPSDEHYIPLPFFSTLFDSFLSENIALFVQTPFHQPFKTFSLENFEDAKSLFHFQKKHCFAFEDMVVKPTFSNRPENSPGYLTGMDILTALEAARIKAEPVTVEINNTIHNALISATPHFPNVLRDLVIQYHNSLPEIHNPVTNPVPRLIHGTLTNIKPKFPKTLSHLIIQYYCPEIPNAGPLFIPIAQLIIHLMICAPIQDSPEFRESINLLLVRCKEFSFDRMPILFFQIDELLDILAYAQYGIRALPFPADFIAEAYSVFHCFQSSIYEMIPYSDHLLDPQELQNLSRIIFEYSCGPRADARLEEISSNFRTVLRAELINQNPNWDCRLLSKTYSLKAALTERFSTKTKEIAEDDAITLEEIDTAQKLETELVKAVDTFILTLKEIIEAKPKAYYLTTGESKRTTIDAPLFSAELLEDTHLVPLRVEAKSPEALTPTNATAENPIISEAHMDQSVDTTVSSSSIRTKRTMLSPSQDTTSAEWIANKKARPSQDNHVDPAHLASIWDGRRVLTAPTEHDAAPASADASVHLPSQATPDANNAITKH